MFLFPFQFIIDASMYDEQQRFINTLATELSTFIQNVIFPENYWMTSPNQLIFDGIYLKLSLLTKNPKVQQANTDYGIYVIDKKHSVSVNLPYLGSSEAAFLGFFGLERCLTLHPTQNNNICSIFDIQNRKLLPNELSLKLLLNLFALAVSMAGFTEIPIFVFGTQQNVVQNQNIIITTLGRCQGHIMRGAFFSGPMRPISDGVFVLQQPLWLMTNQQESHELHNQLENHEQLNSITEVILNTCSKYEKNHLLAQNTIQMTLQAVPLIAKAYSETTTHTNCSTQLSTDHLLQNSQDKISLFDMRDLQNYIKFQNTPKGIIDYNQYLNQDITGNIYINFSDVQAKTIKQSIYNVSQHFNNFLSSNQLLQGQKTEIQDNNTSISSCWSYFDNIKEVTKTVGSAVESICFHFLANFNLTEKTRQNIYQQIIQEYQKGNINYIQYFLNKYFDNESAYKENISILLKQVNNMSTQENMTSLLHRIFQIYEILDEQYIGQTDNQQLVSFPTASAIDIMFSVNFSTAPKGSFAEREIDIHQSMLWAYNATVEQQNLFNKKQINVKRLSQLSKIAYRILDLSAGKAPVAVGEKDMDQVFLFKSWEHYRNYFNFQEQLNTQLTNALQFEKEILKCSSFSYFMLHNVDNAIIFSAKQGSNSQSTLPGVMRHCPPNCILCRLGMIFSQTTMVHAIQIASGFQSDITGYINLKQHISNTRYFDVLNHSIIIQRLVQIDCCQYAIEQLQLNKFEYVPGTMDQTILLYDQYAENGMKVLQNTRIYYYLQAYYIEFKKQQKKDETADKTQTIIDFIIFLQSKKQGSNKFIKYSGKTDQMVNEIINKIDKDKNFCVLYPYDDKFIVTVVCKMFYNKNLQQLFSSQELTNQLNNNYEKTIKSNVQFIKDGLDPRYLVLVCLISYLQNKYIQLQKNILYLIQQNDYDKRALEKGIFYDNQINTLTQNVMYQNFGHVISPQAEYSRLAIKPYYISVDCVNNNIMETFFYHIYYNEEMLANTKLIACYFKTSPKIAYEITHNLEILEGDDREQIYNQICQFLRPLRWELVLNCIRQGKINNEPHKLYAQFGSFQLRNDMIIPRFENLIAFGALETTQYKQYK